MRPSGGRLTRRHLRGAALVMVLATSVSGLALAPASATLADPAEHLGLTCSSNASEDDPPVLYTLCAGKLPSWDSQDRWLETALAFPRGATSPLPTLLLATNADVTPTPLSPPTVFTKKAEGGGGPAEGGSTADEDCCFLRHFNVPWFVSRGYAFLAQTARGWEDSCGPADPNPVCATPTTVTQKGRHTHIAEREFEGHDYRHLLGLVVDAGIADSGRLGATGGSYGAGITWLLATSPPWDTPAPGERRIGLAAAVPFAGWTNVLQFIAPNGRGGDELEPADHEQPIGVFRKLAFEFVHAAYQGARLNSTDPTELHSFMDGWSAFFNKGEPYDTQEGGLLTKALRGKSAYYAEDYLAAVHGRAVPAVPIFALDEWKDPFFGPGQTLPLYRKLKNADPGYPIWVAFVNMGFHASGSVGDETDEAGLGRALHYTLDQVNVFLDAFVRGVGKPPSVKAFSYRQECPDHPQKALLEDLDVGGSERIDASGWDHQLTGGKPVMLSGSGSQRTTSTSQNPDEEQSTGAQSVVPNIPGSKRCIVINNPGNGPPARWTFLIGQAVSYLGLPRLKVDYALTGARVDATVIVKIWDVPPDDPTTSEHEDGFRTLVDRGAYRLADTGGDAMKGTLQFELFGNHWRFDSGHVLQLELSQTDDPFFRPDNFPSTIEFTSPQLTLPAPK